MKTKNIMIVGVGGQGSLLASKLLGHLLMEQGYDVKVSEVHGMSQRGGSVVTYVRYGNRVNSPVIDKGEADYIVSFELLEAARVDGASEFRTFWQISLPLLAPGIVTTALFTIVATWNNYFLPALLLDKAEMKTVPIMIAQLRAADYSKFDLGKVYMFILLAILPVLLVYIFLSHYIVKGVTAGSVKG